MKAYVYTDHTQTEQPITIYDVVVVTVDDRDGILTIHCEKDNNHGHVFVGTHKFHRDHWTHYEVFEG